MPATTSSQKWLAVAITANQTQAGQSSHKILKYQCLTMKASVTPTISASAACRLGIAANGFEASWMNPLPWLMPKVATVSTKPSSGNMRGGAVGSAT